MSKPKLLDLFCGAGGAGMGYHRVGFEVVGVDLRPQPNYPFEFIQGDALQVGRAIGAQFDAIHASPPCQDYSALSHLSNGAPRLIGQVRKMLQALGKPYVIENVMGAKDELINPLMLCGTMFTETKVRRHRLFECCPVVWFPPAACNHDYGTIPRVGRGANKLGFISVGGNFADVEAGRVAMATPWMARNEISQAIPPAYTEFIGKQLMAAIKEALIEP